MKHVARLMCGSLLLIGVSMLSACATCSGNQGCYTMQGAGTAESYTCRADNVAKGCTWQPTGGRTAQCTAGDQIALPGGSCR